jgi:hypothetical protein
MSNDAQAVAELGAVSDVSKPHTVLHYLYVPSSDVANAIASELQRSGYRTEERLGSDGINWLVRARHEAVPTEELMASLRQSMEQLVSPFDGEYDGWEAEVRHHDGNSPSL